MPIKPMVGFPSEDSSVIYISKSDMATVITYVQGLRDWIEAASGCLAGSM